MPALRRASSPTVEPPTTFLDCGPTGCSEGCSWKLHHLQKVVGKASTTADGTTPKLSHSNLIEAVLTCWSGLRRTLRNQTRPGKSPHKALHVSLYMS